MHLKNYFANYLLISSKYLNLTINEFENLDMTVINCDPNGAIYHEQSILSNSTH